MSTKSISFDAESMRQILVGRKGQTRRICDAAIGNDGRPIMSDDGAIWRWRNGSGRWHLPYGPGLRWVKEPLRKHTLIGIDFPSLVTYADGVFVQHNDGIETPELGTNVAWTWKPNHLPAMYCPRWASRLTIEITSVRVERLQEISEADAIAEGCSSGWVNPPCTRGEIEITAADAYRDRWDAISKPGCAWADDPWVWVVSFRRVDP